MDKNSIAKISAVIQFIETHLTEKMDLNRVATAVHYSKYHLHRVFASMVGLTIHDYVQRRRLTEAAWLLVFSSKPIIDIVAVGGYESQQAFTHIFTAMYKQSPNKYRENEKFYPLQLRFRVEGNYGMLHSKELPKWHITLATEDDIACWMDLVRLIIDGFPYLDEEEYAMELKLRIRSKQALILKDDDIAVGVMLFSSETGNIDFMGTHPFYRNKGIPKAFLDKVMRELISRNEISITTYRAGDKADTGHRSAIKSLGFMEAELLTEFDYPTQRFVLTREVADDKSKTKHRAQRKDLRHH